MDDTLELSLDEATTSPPENIIKPIVSEEEYPSVRDHDAFTTRWFAKLDIEEEDFQVHHWHIKNWKSLERRLNGPEFEAGGHKWRILLFPFGNNASDVVSIYLDYADAQISPPGWHACAQFVLVISNPNDPRCYIQHYAHHRFNADEADWGFTRFTDVSKLHNASITDRRSRPLIENDETVISVFLRVIRDTTGVLWHNFANYDSKKETGYVGLKNQGATCYMNSLLQSLYCTNYFRKAVYQIPTELDEPSSSVSLALQRVFYNLQFSDMPVGTLELTKSFGWDSVDSFMQHDVQEFNRVLQDNLEVKMKGTPADGSISKLFKGKMRSYIKCINVPYESSRTEDYYDIQLNVKGCKTLRDSFKDYIAEETLEGDNRYLAEGYGLQDAKKGVSFISFPPVLHLQLKRFEYDIQRDMMVKINDRHEFPLEIDLEEFLDPEADRSKPYKYRLQGVLVHSGNLHGGHYFALLKPEKNSNWFKFDDDRVVPVAEKEVLEDNYGGEIGHGIRYESEIDEILAPVGSEDIPEHLKRRIEEEKTVLETKRREREEMHLYITVKVVTDEIAQHHQGFDLVNFDDKRYPLTDVATFRVARNDTTKTFKRNVAEHFKVSADRSRFWVMVYRQNKTIRPDVLISDALELTMDQVRERLAGHARDLKLYLETASKSFDGHHVFPPDCATNPYIMIFIKYFDPKKQIIENIGRIYVQKYSKIEDLIPVLNEKMGYPANTCLVLYEEIKPGMIEPMKLKQTFHQAEIQDGDIVCFQKKLGERDIQDLEKQHLCATAVSYYDYLANRVLVQFRPKFSTNEDDGFELTLSNKMSYDAFAAKVASHLNIPNPMHLRFTIASPNGTPRNTVRRTKISLGDLLQQGVMRSQLLFYEVLEVSILELETQKMLKVTWNKVNPGNGTVNGNGNGDREEIHTLLVTKSGTVSHLIDALLPRIKLATEGGTGKIRVFEADRHRIHRELNENDPISMLEEDTELYAEEIPSEEMDPTIGDRSIFAFHFYKEPLASHGIPFKFLVRAGEPLSQMRERLRQRLGMSEKEFARVRICLVSHHRCEYIDSEDVILTEMGIYPEDLLGLDHPCKRGTSGEKAIYIRG
ncbi:uncharacterized protein VTP21DRAFT_10768 [Calcarisporiella thermophila]|uniref:uncharacterized protein n=1 Tax=Calcarisporiella thermophila TaxID=911321 RepID=UPI0037431013